MKRLIFLASIWCLAGGLMAQTTIWTFGTARNVPKNQAEFGIVHPLQIGLTETLELSVHPIAGLSLAPNIALKNRWYTTERLYIASKHTYVLPTLLLRRISELPHDGGLFKNNDLNENLAAVNTLPYLFFLRNQGLVTYQTGSESLLTGKIGFAFALQSRGDALPALDQPLFYPFSAVTQKKFLWQVGLQADGNLFKNHNYSASLDFHSIGLGVDQFALVHKAYYIYNHSIRFAALAGYRMMYATYPTDPEPADPFSIFPVLDLIWKINAKKEPVKDLFRR